jgi:Tol biopolymer transport system component
MIGTDGMARNVRRLVGVAVASASVALAGTAASPAPASADVVVIVPGCVVDQSDVLGWWKGEDTLTSEIGPDLTGTTGFGTGLLGRGLALDPNSHLGIDGFPTVSTGITVEMWIKPADTTFTGRVQALASRWSAPSTDDSSRSYALMLGPSFDLVWMTDETSTRRPIELSAPIPRINDGEFHHVAATWDQTTIAIYADGVQIATAPSQGGILNPAATTQFRLGSTAGPGASYPFNGTLDEPSIIKRALTPTEIQSVVDAGPYSKCRFATNAGIVGPGLRVDADQGGVDPVLSPDGRYLLFRTRSSNVLPVVTDPSLQTPGTDYDMFDTNQDDLVLLDNKGTNDPADDTRELVTVDSNGLGGGLASGWGTMTPTASHIAFASISNDLVAGDTLAGRDAFVRNRLTGTTERVSVRSDGSQPQYTATGRNNDSRAPSLSDDGKVVAFESTNRDLAPEANPVAGDTWQQYDIYVRDLTDPVAANHTTARITNGIGGVKANGSSSTAKLSPDGRYVWFTSSASNLVAGDTNGHADIFRYDRQTATTTRVDVTNGGNLDADVFLGDISPDGRWVTFSTSATTITPGDTNGVTDVFLLDAQASTVTRVSPMPGRPQANGASVAGPVSDDGRYVVFLSSATNLVADDTNGKQDVFLTDLVAGSTRRVSTDASNKQRNGISILPSATADASTVIYDYQGVGESSFSIWTATLQLHVP